MISLVVDRIIVREGIRSRVYDALELAARLSHGKQRYGLMMNTF